MKNLLKRLIEWALEEETYTIVCIKDNCIYQTFKSKELNYRIHLPAPEKPKFIKVGRADLFEEAFPYWFQYYNTVDNMHVYQLCRNQND